MKIIPLSEGAFTIDKTKVFVPFNESTDKLNDRPVGSLLVEVQPFLVVTDRDVLLFDTGLGFTTTGGEMQIIQLIRNAGIDPSSVTKVLMSHLHKDHSGGLCSDPKGSERRSSLTFPQALHYIQRQELELALDKDTASYIREDVICLEGARQTMLLDGNGVIDEYIHYEMTSAHSPFHQVFKIIENGRTVFFGGDDAPQLSQMKKRYVAKYDYDGRKCMELRSKWWTLGEEERWTFLFYHDIKSPTFERGV